MRSILDAVRIKTNLKQRSKLETTSVFRDDQIDYNIDYWSKYSSMIYGKSNVQSKAKTDTIGRQRWFH